MIGFQKQLSSKYSMNQNEVLLKSIRMKKKISNALAVLTIAVLLSSCATILGGQVSDCQRTRPAAGQPAREVRGAALIADILLFWPGAVIDFATGAIYRPCNTSNTTTIRIN
jgi:hypothetical protein